MRTRRRHQAEPAALASDLYVFANRRLMSGRAPGPVSAGEPVGYAYWEQPDDPSDSGWRLFVGDETQQDADDPANFQVNVLGTIRTHHPDTAQLFLTGVRGEWERDARSGELRRTT